MSDVINVAKLKVPELRAELRKRNLSDIGLKPVLVKRLEEALRSSPVVVDDESEASDEEVQEAESVAASPVQTSPSPVAKRKRSESTESSPNQINLEEIGNLTSDLRAAHKENDRLRFEVDQWKARLDTAKAEARAETRAEVEAEYAQLIKEKNATIHTSQRKLEELQFSLSQKDEIIKSKSQDDDQGKCKCKSQIVAEQKKREMVEFQADQLRDQVEESRAQNQALQSKLTAAVQQIERNKKDNERAAFEQQQKYEVLQLSIQNDKDKLLQTWRAEFEANQRALEKDLRKQQKEAAAQRAEFLATKQRLEQEHHAKLTELSDLEAQLKDQEQLQEQVHSALLLKQQSIDQDETRMAGEKSDVELQRQQLCTEKQELEEHVWALESDSKRRREREKTLEAELAEVKFDNEHLRAELACLMTSKPQPVVTQESMRPPKPVVAQPAGAAAAKSSNRPSLLPKPKPTVKATLDSGKENHKENATLKEPTEQTSHKSSRLSGIPVRRGSTLIKSGRA